MLLRNSAFFPVEYFSVSFYQANDFSEKKKKKIGFGRSVLKFCVWHITNRIYITTDILTDG